MNTRIKLIQSSAGSGKTWSIVQELAKSRDIITYIYLTKMHSAKDNILNEIFDQFATNQLNITIEYKQFDKYHVTDIQDHNQYIINFKGLNANNQYIQKQVIIGTVDSFIHQIALVQDKFPLDYTFLANKISQGCCISPIKYRQIDIDSHTTLILDEIQDLNESYGSAFMYIQNITQCYLFAVGDLLQSLWQSQSIMQQFSQYIVQGPSQVRRFKNPHLMSFVNNVVSFDKYSQFKVVPISSIDPKHANDFHKQKPQLVCVSQFNYKKQKQYEGNIYIVEQIKKQQQLHGYKPNDFLIISPYIKNNPQLAELSSMLQEHFGYQHKNELNENETILFFYIHRSQEENSIDLNISKDMSRGLSVQSAKGLGANVVFVCGFNTYNLQSFSENSLVYESFIHVALTRAKQQLYILFENNNDDLSSRLISAQIKGFADIQYFDNVQIPYNNLIAKPDKFKSYIINKYPQLTNTILNESAHLKTDKSMLKVDYNHHILRQQALSLNFKHCIQILRFSKTYDNITTEQYYKQLSDFSKYKVVQCIKSKSYHQYMSWDNTTTVIVQSYYESNSNKQKNTYSNIIYQYMKELIVKINSNKNLSKLCVFEQLLYQFAIYQLSQKYQSQISQQELIEVTQMMYMNFNTYCLQDEQFNKIHKNCNCKNYFGASSKYTSSSDISQISQFYKQLGNIPDIVQQCKDKGVIHSNQRYLFVHPIRFVTDLDLEIKTKIECIGFDDKETHTFQFFNKFNDLNYQDNVVQLAIDQYIIQNCNRGRYENQYKQTDITMNIIEPNLPLQQVQYSAIVMTGIQSALNKYLLYEQSIYIDKIAQQLKCSTIQMMKLLIEHDCPDFMIEQFVQCEDQIVALNNSDELPAFIDQLTNQIKENLEESLNQTLKVQD